MEWMGEGLDGSTGMTKPQPCPHHKDADPAEVPKPEVRARGGSEWHCGICWRNHALWLQSTVVRLEEAIHDNYINHERELATAKADTERLADLEIYLLNLCAVTCQDREKYRGKLQHTSNCPVWDMDIAPRQAIDATKESE